MAINWESKYCERANGIYGSMTRQLMHLIANPEVISFGGGLPASELFPVDQVKAITHDVLDQKGMAVLQYGTSEGYEPLRQAVVERYTQRGFDIGLENVLITSGAQQGIDLVSKLFVGKGDLIVVGDPTFLTALQTFNLFQADYLTVPVDAEGMQMERLPGILEARNVKFIYIMPNFQNPSGATLSLERRRQMMEIVRHYQVPVVEDDAYGELRYDGAHLPALKSMDPDGQVIYLGSFSKVLSPGIRVSALIAEKNLMEKLVFAKQAADLHTDNLAQHIIYEFMRRDLLDRHIARLIDFYRKRRDAMIQAMTTYLPVQVTCPPPKVGFFCGPRCPRALIPASFSKKRWKPRSLMCRAPATTPKAAASAACG